MLEIFSQASGLGLKCIFIKLYGHFGVIPALRRAQDKLPPVSRALKFLDSGSR
jgi:hypothetical protein